MNNGGAWVKENEGEGQQLRLTQLSGFESAGEGLRGEAEGVSGVFQNRLLNSSLAFCTAPDAPLTNCSP